MPSKFENLHASLPFLTFGLPLLFVFVFIILFYIIYVCLKMNSKLNNITKEDIVPLDNLVKKSRQIFENILFKIHLFISLFK